MLGRSSGVNWRKLAVVAARPVLTAMYWRPSTAKLIGKPETGDPEVDFPEHFAGLVIEGVEASRRVAAEDEAAAGGDEGKERGPLLVQPGGSVGVHDDMHIDLDDME